MDLNVWRAFNRRNQRLARLETGRLDKQMHLGGEFGQEQRLFEGFVILANYG